MTGSRSVCVVGGGITGLVGAYRLAQNGYKVCLIEKDRSLGGLASGFFLEGAHIEKAYHHIFRSDRHLLELSRELNVIERLGWFDSSVAIYYNGSLSPFSTPLDLINFQPLHLTSRLRLGLVSLFLGRYKHWENLEKVTAYDWLLKYSGRESFKVVWEPLLKGKFGRYYKDISMAWLWSRLHVRYSSREGNTEKLGYFTGGFRVLTDAISSALENYGVEILTEADIEDFNLSVEGKINISYSKGSLNHFKVFDKVICTFPNSTFLRYFENKAVNNDQKEYIERLRKIHYLGAICLVFSSKQSLSKFYWHNINDTTIPFLVFIQHTNLIDASNYNGSNIYYIGKYLDHSDPTFSYTEEQTRSLWFEGLRKIFPDFDPEQVHQWRLFKFKNAQHIVDTEYSQKIPSYNTPFKNIYLANFSQIYPEDRGVNYAIREGDKFPEIVTL